MHGHFCVISKRTRHHPGFQGRSGGNYVSLLEDRVVYIKSLYRVDPRLTQCS